MEVGCVMDNFPQKKGIPEQLLLPSIWSLKHYKGRQEEASGVSGAIASSVCSSLLAYDDLLEKEGVMHATYLNPTKYMCERVSK